MVPGLRLRLKGTFIDVDAGEGARCSPRAHSEPPIPVLDGLYFEEQRQYVAELSNRDWRGSCSTSQRKQPLVSRRTLNAASFRTNPSSEVFDGNNNQAATGSRDTGQNHRERTSAASTATSGSLLGPRHLSLWSLLQEIPLEKGFMAASRVDCHPAESTQLLLSEGQGQEHIQAPSSNTLTCGTMETAATADSKHNDLLNQPDLSKLPACESYFTRVLGDGSAVVAEAEAASQSGSWYSHMGPTSEAGSRGIPCCTSRQESQWHVHDVTGGPEDINVSLSHVTGKWQVIQNSEKLMDAGVWTIQDDGRAFFNGKRFGNDYDITEHTLQEGSTVIKRGDGWTVQNSSIGSDQLVWTKDGEAGKITWTRKRTKSEIKGDSQETHTELRSKMEASAQQMSGGWASGGRLSSALAVIEEIPMRISEDMQRAASYVVDNMQSEVAAVSKQIRGNDWPGTAERHDGENRDAATTEKVIKNLEVIPTMVQNLLEARVQKARDKVRHRVHGMIQNLSVIQEENWSDRDGLVSEMRMISEEVEKIAGDAVKAAAEECHAHAVRQLDFAMHVLRDQKEAPSEAPSGQEASMEQQISSCSGKWEVTHDPEFWPKAVADANFAKDSMERAVAVVQDKDYIPQSFTNQVVANELLRARIRSGGGGCRRDLEATTVSRPVSSVRHKIEAVCTNPGSLGHPESCPRPCFFYSQGKCRNGNDCNFCHMPHMKRSVRFDKQHRDELKRTSFVQLLDLVLPVLKQKAKDLEFGPDEGRLLERLWQMLEETAAAERLLDESGGCALPGVSCARPSGAMSSNASHTGSERSSRQRSSFSGALHLMGFHSLLAMVADKVPKDVKEVYDLVELAMQTTRERWGASRFASTTFSVVSEVEDESAAVEMAQSRGAKLLRLSS